MAKDLCQVCHQNYSDWVFHTGEICNECFEKKYGKMIIHAEHAEYYGGHKAFLAGGYFSKFQSGEMHLTQSHLIFSKGGKDMCEIIIPLRSVVIENWRIEEESRRKDVAGGGVLGQNGFGLGGGTIHESGKAHHFVVLM